MEPVSGRRDVSRRGVLAAEARPGVRVSVNDQDAADGARGRDPDAAGAAQKHVLYVDDDDAIVYLMTRLLARQGYRVSGYTDASAALAAVRAGSGQFDLAVTDYNMPGMSGLEVAEALREIRADLPVVIASGYITDELRAKAPAAGARELIFKPDTVEELCGLVARLANGAERTAVDQTELGTG